jgi:hypothetical protein
VDLAQERSISGFIAAHRHTCVGILALVAISSEAETSSPASRACNPLAHHRGRAICRIKASQGAAAWCVNCLSNFGAEALITQKGFPLDDYSNSRTIIICFLLGRAQNDRLNFACGNRRVLSQSASSSSKCCSSVYREYVCAF